ncbi:cupin domain-containing protein [Haloarchaeobius sp. TZWSO28]|uniref:cupin domain-containing protein n=1 Tax=Haloarchaeobius sp. TZWSO28 TaxID=3446119 RepID=UPI003EB6D171
MQFEQAVSVVQLADLAGDQHPDSTRTVTTIFDTDGVTLSRTTLAPGATTGWHTHGDRDAYGYVLAGRLELAFGPDGGETMAATDGDFFHLPAGLVHRTTNPGASELVVLVAFIGSGPTRVPVDGPRAADPTHQPRVAGADDLVPTAPLKNLTRLMPFPDADVQQVRGHAAGRIESDWHHHGDNDVFGVVLGGEGYVEYGTGPDDRALARAGECFHIPSGLVHRDVNPSDAEQDYVLWLTGSDPRVVHVDEPTGD